MKQSAKDLFLTLLGEGLTLFFLMAGCLMSIQTGYQLELDLRLLWAAAGFLTLVTLTVFHLPRFQGLVLAAAAAAWGVWVWRNWEGLRAGILSLVSRSVQAFQNWDESLFPQVDQGVETGAFLSVVILWAFLMAWSLLRARAAALTMLLAWGVLVPAFCIDGPVSWPALFLLGAGSISAVLSAGTAGEQSGGAGGCWRLLTLGVSLLALFLLTAAIPREGYTYPQWATDARLWLTSHQIDVNQIFSLLDPGSETQGLSDQVDFSQTGPRSYTGSTRLEVESSWEGNLYLRGYTLGKYTASGWEELDSQTYESLLIYDQGEVTWTQLIQELNPFTLSAQAQDNDTERLQVVDLGDPDGWVYTPYQIAGLEGLEIQADGRVTRSDGQWQHQFVWKPADLTSYTPLTGELSGLEGAYDYFVQANYLEIPEELEEFLQPYTDVVLSGLGERMDALTGIPEEFRRPVAAAQGVAALLAESAVYDLSVSAPDAGSDFVTWFLGTSGRGYCVHFASAGTMLLRSLGIPARYASGYAVHVLADQGTRVPDSAAHAWTEIYLEGYGWYPVEMTPPDGTGLLATDPEESAQEPPETEETQPEQAETDPALEEEQSPEPAPEQPQEITPEEDGAAPQTNGGGWPAGLLWGGGVFAVLALLGLIRLVFLNLREDRCRQEDRNRAMLEIYASCRRLKFWGGRMPKRVHELGEKARFSPHQITQAEWQEAITLLAKARRETGQKISPALRWIYWLIWNS